VTVASKPPDNRRGGVLYPVEGNRWVVTLGGISRDYPPNDEAGFLDFARSLRSPIIYEAIKDAQPSPRSIATGVQEIACFTTRSCPDCRRD
jgi:hypothetical protein